MGDCWDHFSVIYTYPNDVVLTFCSRQAGDGYDDLVLALDYNGSRMDLNALESVLHLEILLPNTSEQFPAWKSLSQLL